MATLALQAQYSNIDLQKMLSVLKTEGDFVGLRYVHEQTQHRVVRNRKVENNLIQIERGVMVEVHVNGQIGYAGTSQLDMAGLQKAAQHARMLATDSAQIAKKSQALFSFSPKVRPPTKGRHQTNPQKNLDSMSVKELVDGLIKATQYLQVSEKIINTLAEIFIIESHHHYVTTAGADIEQKFLLLSDNYSVTAKNGNQTQRRSMNGPVARCSQRGLEILDWDRLYASCQRVGEQAIELLAAEECPVDQRDLILMPDQMLLQIHESIGHPLELDRILGDERNYAGWSFVKPDDFGKLQYGSSQMNVTFDPTVETEFASYAFDDCGAPATKEFLIKDGILQRGLGSLESQERLKTKGVANFRASSWNRAPIDRMANINLEPGTDSLEKMIASTESGILMESNTSWSIDDYRRKFQFGCEYARLIENGKLTRVVRQPNYRGTTTDFWNRLKMVGTPHEVGVFGSPYCGKGEPQQVIRVGHSSPPCLFSQIEVFGGG